MAHALLPGTFSPPTLGHADLIKRAAGLFDILTIGVAVNISKPNHFFTIEEKIALLKIITINLPNVRIKPFEGLVADYCQNNQIAYIVRGIRSTLDYEYEYQMAIANRQLGGIETMLFVSEPKYSHLSSSMAREVANFGHRLNGFVPDEIEEAVFEKLKSINPKSPT